MHMRQEAGEQRACLRLAVIVAAVVLALCPTRPDARAAAGDGGVGAATKAALRQFSGDARDAYSTFKTGAANASKALSRGDVGGVQAVSDFADALGFFAERIHVAANAAEESATQGLSAAMAAEGTDELAGAQVGGGGRLDAFLEKLDAQLDKQRRKAQRRARSFARTVKRKGGSRAALNVSLPTWTAPRRVAPTVANATPTRELGPRLLGALAARVEDQVVVAVFGSAAASLDNQFDVRLDGLPQRPLHAFLDDGGTNVTPDGTWRSVGTVGNPFGGDAVDPGNRSIVFGVEPEDQGLAGIQPRRLVHAGVISIP